MIDNSTLLELLAWDATDGIRHPERHAERSMLAASPTAAPRQPASGACRGVCRSVRGTVASYLVRLGLRLDPAAGGDLGQPLSTHAAHTEGRRCA